MGNYFMKYVTIKAKFKSPKKKKNQYDQKQLKKGMKVEAEHSPSKKVQAVVTMNHLDEDENYYNKKAKKLSKTKRRGEA